MKFPYGKVIEDTRSRQAGVQYRYMRVEFYLPRDEEVRLAFRKVIVNGEDVTIGRTKWRPYMGSFQFSTAGRRCEAEISLVRA